MSFKAQSSVQSKMRLPILATRPAATGQRAVRRAWPSFLFAGFLIVMMSAFGVTDCRAQAPRSKSIIFVAGGPSHGFLGHDYLAGSHLLADRLNAIPGFTASVYYQEWPKPDVLEAAAAIVIYADGGPDSIAIDHRDELVRLSKKGTGVGLIHYAVEVPKLTGGAEWLAFAGGYFETFYSINPFWTARFQSFPNHPVTRGVAPFSLDDEWYFNMRFRSEMKGVEPILSAIPPDDTRSKKDDAHEGNPIVRNGIGKNLKETVLWVNQNYPDAQGKPISRGFGCTGGHSHQNWANDQFRKIVLNAIVWIAQGDVPDNGVPSKRPDVDELLSNRDPGVPGEQIPANFDRAGLATEIERLNKAR